MAEFGVRHEHAVDEQPRADTGAEREHHHDALTTGGHAVPHLGQPGGVSVVDHVHADTERLGEDLVGVDVQPRLVDVRRRSDDAVANDRRKCAPDRALPAVMADELDHDLGHRLGGRGLRCVDSVAVGDQRSGCEVDDRRLHPTAADVDAEGVTGRVARRGRHESPR